MNTSGHTPQHASHTPGDMQTSTVQKRPYTEHRILRGASAIYTRHYAGTGPALVLMHGFPDNLHIYFLLEKTGLLVAALKRNFYTVTSKQAM